MLMFFSDEWANELIWRSSAAFFSALLLIFLFAPRFIHILARWHQGGSTVREDVPEAHLKKIGTPSMGGLMIVAAVIVATLLWADLGNLYIVALIGVILVFALIGLSDDLTKIRRQSKGISGRVRLALEGGAALLFIGVVYVMQGDQAFLLYFPFFLDWGIPLSFFMVPLALFVIVGSANAVNLTDGLDGLAVFPVFIATFCFAVIAYSALPADQPQAMVSAIPEIIIFCAAAMGACLGFLWFNASPAQVFMGDTGSLALGGMLGSLSVITQSQLAWVIIGGVFVVETLSVIIQVAYFRRTGKRIFAMAPLHHHFEKKGWPEVTIVIRFWIFALILGAVGVLGVAA